MNVVLFFFRNVKAKTTAEFWFNCFRGTDKLITQSCNDVTQNKNKTKTCCHELIHENVFFYQDPHEVEEMEILCFFFCTSRSITARVTVDRTGYVPGETIAVTCMVDNESRRKVERCAVKLQKVRIGCGHRLYKMMYVILFDTKNNAINYNYRNTSCSDKKISLFIRNFR